MTIEFFCVFGHKIGIFNFSCAIALFFFIIAVLELGVHTYFVVALIPIFSLSVILTRIETSAPVLLW